MEENTSPHDRRDSLKNPNQSGGIASPSKRTPFKNISNNISPLKPADNSWVERTEVITKQNPENHKRFAKDLIEEIIPKVLDISKRKLPFREQRLKSQEESDSDLETEFEPNESAVHCPAASPDVSTNSLNNDTLSESKLSEQLVASSTPAARNPASLSPVDAIHKEIKGALELLKCFEKLGVSSPNTCKISLEKAKFRSADNFFNPFSTNSKLKTSNEELHKTFDNQIKDLELLLEDGTAQPHDCTLEELYETAQLIPGDESFNLTKEFNNIKLVDKSLSQGNYDSTGVGNVISVEDFQTDVKESTVEESVIQSEGSALNEQDQAATSSQETSTSKYISKVPHEVMDDECVVVDSAANVASDQLESNTLVTETASGDTCPFNNRVQGTDVTEESTSASTTVSEEISNTEELCAVTQTCTATVDPNTSSQKVNTIVHTAGSEDGATNIENCDDEPKLSEAGKCKVEAEEEEIVVPSKEYDVGALSKLDDPDFNPFVTKSAVCNSPDSKSINQERPVSVPEDTTDGNVPSALKEAVSIQDVPISATEASVKEGVCTLQQEFTSDNADPNSALEDNTTEKSANEDCSNVEKGEDKLESCEKETFMIEIEEEIIVPSKEYDVEVLPKLEDPTFNPFTTKSAVCNSPESKTIQKSLPGTTEIIEEMEEEAKTIDKSRSEDGLTNVEKSEDELESSGKENLPLSVAKKTTDEHRSALGERVCTLMQESTSDQSDSNTHSQKAKRKSNDKSSEDGLIAIENCEDKPKLSEAEKSKVEVEEEEIVVPSKEYDVDALSKLDDPDFNPFVTKSVVCNSPDSKSINQERPVSEDTTDGNVPSALKEEAVIVQDVPISVTESSVIVKEESKNDNEISTSKQKCISDHTKPSPATQDSKTVDKPAGEDVSTDAKNSHDESQFSNEKENSEFEIEEEEIIVPSKEYDDDVLSRLEDPNFNPFTTKSAVCNSPESKSLNQQQPLSVAKETTDEHTVSAVREEPTSTQEFSTSDNAVSDTSSPKPKTDLNKSMAEDATPKIEKCESELKPLDKNEEEIPLLTASEDEIIPKQEYDREVLSKLDDLDFNPFGTKSAVCNSPDSKSIIHNTTVTTEITHEQAVPAEMENEAKAIEKSGSEVGSANVEKGKNELESSEKEKSMIEIQKEVPSKLDDPDFNPFVTKSAVCNSPDSKSIIHNTTVTTEIIDEEAVPEKEVKTIEKSASEDNSTRVEKSEDKLESSGKEKSMIQIEEKDIVPSKEYDVGVLSKLEDLTFNPFVTKSAVCNSPEPKNMNESINVSVTKETTEEHAASGRNEVPPCNTTFKEENTSLDKFATEENATPMEDCKDALEEKPSLKSDDENVIVPVKKLDLDFQSQLDDTNFNPFATKSAVSNSPDSKNIPKEIVETESPNETLNNSDAHLNEVLENTEGKRTSTRGNLLTNEDDSTKTKPLSLKSPQNNKELTSTEFDFEIDTSTSHETPSDATVVFDDSVFSKTVTEECSSSKSNTVNTTIDDHIPGSVSQTKTGFESEEFSSDFSVLDTISQERESERLHPPADVFRKSICSLEFDEIAKEAIDLAKEMTPLTTHAKPADTTNKYSDFSGEEFASATDFFSTETDLEALCSLGSCSSTANLARNSLFVKFDPLIAACMDNDIDPRRGSALISFSPLKKPASVPGSTLLPRPKADGIRVTVGASSRLSPDEGRNSFLGEEDEEEEEANTTILLRTQDSPLLPPRRIHATKLSTKPATSLATRETQTEEEVVSVADRDATLKKTEIIYQDILLRRSREFEEMKSVLVEEIKRKEGEVGKMEEEKRRISKMASLFKSMLTEIVAKKAKMESEFGAEIKEEAKRREEEVGALKKELKSQQEEMAQSERTFFDLVKKQERLRQIVESLNNNNSILKSENKDLSGKIKDKKAAFLTAFKDMEAKIGEANEKFAADRTQQENEMNKAGMLLKRAEMKIVLQADALTKKDAEIRMMSALMDDWSKKFDA